MQIVIDIAKSKWETIQNGMYCGLLDGEMYQAIKNGTVLPEHHGRLIDADTLIHNIEFACMGVMSGCDPYDAPLKEVSDAPTILEASERGKE